MTNDELVEAIVALLSCYEQMEQSQLRTDVYVSVSLLIDELRDRARGFSPRGATE
jgi:hypothetical protein